MEYFEFIETPVFSRQRETLLDDDSFRELQTHLLKYHADGDTISKTVGRKKNPMEPSRHGETRWCKSYLLRHHPQRQALPVDCLS